MSSELFHFGNIAFNNVSFQEALEIIFALAKRKGCSYVVTPNVDHVVCAENDSVFQEICQNANLVVADGMPIVWASRLLRHSLKAKISGSDLTVEICRKAAQTGHRIFLLGGLEGEALMAKANLLRRFPGLQIVGTYSPPFGFENDPARNMYIIDMINAAMADIILVGVGSPKQEKWIFRHRHSIKQGVLLGIGISIAFCAKTIRRAPPWMQKWGLEWVYRLSQEPRRLALRYLKDFYIVIIFLRQWRHCLMGR